MTVGEVLRRATEFLAGKGVDSPRLDAEHLLGKALGLSRVELYMHHDRPLPTPSATRTASSCAGVASASRSPTCSASGASGG